MSKEGAARMGMQFGKSYGAKIDALVAEIGGKLTPHDFLRLAWACVDQASSQTTERLADVAMDAIEELYDAGPEEEPEAGVALSKDEERALLMLPLARLSDVERPFFLALERKGLAYFDGSSYIQTPAGRWVAQMASAT